MLPEHEAHEVMVADALQGVCKDCGNGTLNNKLNPVFDFDEETGVTCLKCGSSHVDVVIF